MSPHPPSKVPVINRRPRPRVAMLLAAALLVGFVPAATAQSGPQVIRRSGADRYATAAAVSAASFEPGVAEAWVATGVTFPDALSVGPVAGSVGSGPVLLVTRDDVPSDTADELERLAPSRITVLGGPDAVSSAVVNELRRYTDGVVRQFSESDRYATAARVAQELAEGQVGVSTVLVATGTTFADALAGGAAGAAEEAPLLLVEPDELPGPTIEVLEQLAPDEIVVLGGLRAVSAAVQDELEAYATTVTRVSGGDRYDTAARISARTFDPGVDTVHLTTGENFPDALAATPAAGQVGGPVLITRADCLPAPIADEIDRLAPDRIVVLGGEDVVSSDAAGGQRCDDAPEPEPSEVAVRTTTITTDVELPWDVVFTPDGRTFVTERDTGRLKEVADDGTTATVATFDVDPAGEGGLLGLAVSPTYAEDGLLYAYLTTDTDNRIVRFRPGSNGFSVVYSGITANTFHDAGRIDFGPDGMLYAGVGDAGDVQSAQDLDDPNGKILRLTPAGGVPPDNPFADRGSPVWAYGLRDPQGLAWTADGTMYASEFGPDRDDEINRIVPGGNYAWGTEPGGQDAQPTGVTNDPRFVDPIFVQQPPQASWSGMTALVDGAIPQWEGDLFVAALRGTRLYRLDLAEGEFVGSETVLDGRGRLRHAAQAPDGSLWILTSNGGGNDAIYRMGG